MNREYQMRRLLLMMLLWCLSIVPIAAQNTPDCKTSLEIWQIQGRGDEAHCLNQTIITTENIVTSVGVTGLFIQSPPEQSDNDPETSDGIFVFTNFPPMAWEIAPGDIVIVEGRVKEFYNLSQIESGRRLITKVAAGADVPDPVDLLALMSAQLENYEGMRVQVTDAEVFSPTNQFNEFAISLTGKRGFREAGIETDMTPEFAGLGLPEWDLNREIIEIDPPEMGLPVEQVTVGSRVTAVGNLSYAYQDYQLWATELSITPAEFEGRPVRPAAEGEFTIATQNVENLYDTIDDPNVADNTFEDYVPDDEAAYQLKLRKLAAQIRIVLNALDIVAVQEVENLHALSDLAAQIQADDPAIAYDVCLLQGNDGRGINNGYLIRVDRVRVLDCIQMPGSIEARASSGGALHDRPPLVLEAELLLEDDAVFPVTLINLHNKSLSGSDTTPVQIQRMEQAADTARYIQSRINENPDIHLIVLGDLNAFQFSDGLVDMVGIISGTHDPTAALHAPAEDLLEPNLINQVLRVPEANRYSYIFNHNSQVLDHILTTPGLDALVTDIQISRGNADALLFWAEEDNGAFRSSDHDGIVLYLQPE